MALKGPDYLKGQDYMTTDSHQDTVHVPTPFEVGNFAAHEALRYIQEHYAVVFARDGAPLPSTVILDDDDLEVLRVILEKFAKFERDVAFRVNEELEKQSN